MGALHFTLKVVGKNTKGEDSNFEFFEAGGPLNGPNLFTELPFLWKSLPHASFTELPPPFLTEKPFFTHWKVLRGILKALEKGYVQILF